MTGAEIVLVANIVVASMFAASYFIVALLNPSQRGARWFGGTYLIGLISPVSDFIAPFSTISNIFEWLSYASFLAAVLLMSASFSVFYGMRAPVLAIICIFLGGVLMRACIWNWTRDTFAYGFAYQVPLALAALLAVNTVLRVERRSMIHIALAGVFAAIAVNLALKPFLAVMLGSGKTLSAYSTTTYALISQGSTGVLLLAAGILLILTVAQDAITELHLASETDALSGLANRRGFDRQAQEILDRAAHDRASLSVAVFDLDHFKRINDMHGHHSGDMAIASFAALMRNVAPASAVLGRIGGDEFAMLVDGRSSDGALVTARHIRAKAWQATNDGAFAATVSCGVAECRHGETLAAILRRADQALYRAKSEGRNRVCVDSDSPGPADRSYISFI